MAKKEDGHVEEAFDKHRALPENIGQSSDQDTEKVFDTTLWVVAIATVAALWGEALWIVVESIP